jgi:FlaA1/EpsC-like NDP-sugar epimerase
VVLPSHGIDSRRRVAIRRRGDDRTRLGGCVVAGGGIAVIVGRVGPKSMKQWQGDEDAWLQKVPQVAPGGLPALSHFWSGRLEDGSTARRSTPTVDLSNRPPGTTDPERERMCLKGKSIVFTGGSTSIGKATAPPLRRAVPM